MNIGFVSTWFERGASYVTRAYMDLLDNENQCFVYARGGEEYAQNDPHWDLPNVTWGLKLGGWRMNYQHFFKWVVSNNLDIVFFNEQKDIEIVAKLKKDLPQLKIGTYVDYYKEDTVDEFKIYDFIICNTKRHYSVFEHFPQTIYVPWGTDTELFLPINDKNDELTFFHSVGMSTRKGTKLLTEAFIHGEIFKRAKLIIHSQIDIEKNFGFSKDTLSQYNIEVIEKTVSAPGLYHLGDVYVYPTTLDGLGLTLYEALSCGLPVITTDNAPMNEVINHDVGYLVEVEKMYSRSDGYYWPLSICNEESLIHAMKFYVDHQNDLESYRKKARLEAVEKYNWSDRKEEIHKIFSEAKVLDHTAYLDELIRKSQTRKRKELRTNLMDNVPAVFHGLISRFQKK